MTAHGPAGWKLRRRSLGALAVPMLVMAGCAQTPHPRAVAATGADAPPAAPAVLGLGSAQRTAIACARSAGLDVAAFTACAQDRLVLSQRQRGIVDCALRSQASRHFAECVAPQVGVTLSRPQIVTADCAIRSGGTGSAFIACTGTAAAGRRITPRERIVLGCAAKANDDATRFTACSAQQILGPGAGREGRIALACAAQTGGDYAAFATCAGANLFNVKLNPDQTVAIECVIQAGGLPTAAVGCMAARFLARELRSCATKGFGGAHGCFGDDNMVVGRNGWTMHELGRLGSERAAMMASIRRWQETRLMPRTRNWWTGTGRFVRDPAAYWRSRGGAGAGADVP